MSALSSIFGALKYVPATVARKALEKVNPGFGNYFSKAISYGVDANRALDFLMDRFESEAQRTRKQELEKGAAQGTLRPDEMLSRSEMGRAEMIPKALKTAAAFGAGALAGGIPIAAAQAAGQAVQPSQSARFGDKSIAGPEEMGPPQGLMGPFRQGSATEMGPFQKEMTSGTLEQAKRAKPLTREEALKQQGEVKKRKKLFDQLKEEFEGEYPGEGVGAKEQLIGLTQEGLNILRNLQGR